MEILFIVDSHRIIHPDTGASVRNNLFVRALLVISHVDIITFAIDNEVSDIPNCDVIYSKKVSDSVGRIGGGIHSIICATLWPENTNPYYKLNKKKEAIIDSLIKRKKYDIITCRYVETAIKCGLLKYKDKLIIDADDNLVSILKYKATQARSVIDKWKKKYKSKRIGKMQNKLLSSILCSFCSNKSELPSPQTIFLPNTSILNERLVESSISNRLLFVGLLTFYPNKQGITHFVDTIFPIIKHINPQIQLRIVGESEPDFLSYLNNIDGVEAVGRVDDLSIEYQKATVVVIPIYYGSGTSVKFVEALFMNRPVVSSLMGARGFSEVCQDGVHYMLANNDQEFAEKTIELLSSASKRKEMANNGYLIASKHFSQERFMEIVKESILRCMENKRAILY